MIKRFFECLIPVTICNLECEYCYVIQREYRNMKKNAETKGRSTFSYIEIAKKAIEI